MADIGDRSDQAALEVQRWEWEGGRIMAVEEARVFNISLQYANEMAAAARAGDTDAAQVILGDFVFAIDRWRRSIRVPTTPTP
jgi:hypothetical protein